MFVFYIVFFLEVGISNLSVVLEKMLDMISVFLNLLRLYLWPRMLLFLEDVTCALE